MRFIFISLLTVLSLNISNAQSLEVGLMLGGGYYSGDMDAPEFSTNLKKTKFSYGLFGRYHLSNKLAVRASLSVVNISSADSLSSAEWQQLRNLSFTNTIVELSTTVEYSLLKFDPTGANGGNFTPYVFAGLAYYKHNPKTLYQGQTIELQPLGTEGQGMLGYDEKYSLRQMTIPFGGGLKYAINDRVVIAAEINGRRAFTDHLDDLSVNYVAYEDLLNGNGALAASLGDRTPEITGMPSERPTGSTRGSSKVKDYYFTGMVSFSYTLDSKFGLGGGGQIGCPTF